MERNSDKKLDARIRRSGCITNLCVERRDEAGEENRTISGYATRFNEWSKPFCGEWVEMIDARAFDGCDMSDVVMCTDHGSACSDVLARSRSGEGSLQIEIDPVGVKFSFDAPNTTRGNDILEQVRRGDIGECSFAFSIAEDSWRWKRADPSQEYDQRVVTKIAKLYDLSVVVVGQYNNTSAIAERGEVTELRAAACNTSAEIARARDFLSTEIETINK